MTRLPSKFFAALACVTAVGAAQADDALWKTVQEQPNIVLLMRHGESQRERGRNGLAYDAGGQCQGEIMLSELGRKNVELVGKVFKAQGVMPQVVASALCRTRDTAMLAFGKTELDPALRPLQASDKVQLRDFLAASAGWIKRYRSARPLAMVMHFPNIDALVGEQPKYGEMVVTRADEQGELDVLGSIVLYQGAAGD